MSGNAVQRAAWQRRYAGTLAGGAPLFVALAMAEELADPTSGAVTVGGRELAEITGLARSTVQQAIATAGLFKTVERGRGRRPSRYVLAAGGKAANTVDKSSPGFRSGRWEGRNSGREGLSVAAD